MRAPLAAVAGAGVAAGLVALASPALAAPSAGMVLSCRDGRTLTRSNGASWWGLAPDGTPDGSVYVTTHLRVVQLADGSVSDKSYGTDRPQPTDICTAQHGPFPDYPGATWTVTLHRVT